MDHICTIRKRSHMPRRKREWYEGACYHVMGRGNRHCAIFKEKEDYQLFLMLLAKVKERTVRCLTPLGKNCR